MNTITHIYIIFIACCFAYGFWGLYNYVQYLHDTIQLQDDAIKMLQLENRLIQIQNPNLNYLDNNNDPLNIFPKSIIH